MRRSDDALATIALVSRLCADGLRPLKAAEFWKLAALTEEGPGRLLGMGASEVAALRGVPMSEAERAVTLLERSTALAFELEGLERSGIRTLTPFDERYPQRLIERLGFKAPPLLYAAGATDLLDVPGLGVVGSRNVGEAGAEVARDAAKRAAARGIPVVSGGARGIDQMAMDAAFEAGGAVAGVLADSLVRKLRSPAVRAAIHDERVVLCTPYSPSAGFSAGSAMGRNKLVYALAAVTLVVASELGSGGTWTGASESLDQGFGHVAVWRGLGEGPGNGRLEQAGATAVADIADVDALLDSPLELPSADPRLGRTVSAAPDEQGTLFEALASTD